jgi:diguanylate cyclase (GGDEF)-like protein/PAS domain S-box-containing protein
MRFAKKSSGITYYFTINHVDHAEVFVGSLLTMTSSWEQVFRVLPENDVLIVDDEHIVSAASRTLLKLMGDDSSTIIGHSVETVFESWPNDVFSYFSHSHAGKSNFEGHGEATLLTRVNASGERLSLEAHIGTLALEGHSWIIVLASSADAQHQGALDSSQLHQLRLSQLAAAEVLAESLERFRHFFQDNMAPMMLTDIEDRIIDVNEAFCQMIGWTRHELMRSDSTPFTFPEDIGISENTNQRITQDGAKRARYVKRYLHRDGRVIVVEISKSAAYDAHGDFLYYVISERDITEERALSAQLTHQALHDPLTGLANRAVFEDRLHQAQARIVRQGGVGAVLLIDLDDFKGVNDTHGHVVGDQLLTTIAHRLENATRLSDTLCRFGGDEFLYLAEGLHSAAEAEQLAVRLREEIAQPLVVAGVQLEVHASVGVVVWDGKETEYSQIIQNADSAMYEAKRRGKGNHVIFTANLQQQAVNRFALTQELRHAIQAGEISMHFQPIMELPSSEIVGFEALMRWQHPERGMVPPNVFIALAEQSDLILELGAFALNEAVKAAATWGPTNASGHLPFVTVNFSSRQFHDVDLKAMVVDALMKSSLDPKRLIIEITESATLLDVAETLQVIEHLNRIGIGIALDDFGTGYSSLSYLTLLHPRIIKIDRSFVSPTHENIHNDTLLQTIVSLGRKLNMTVLAEGIETHGQLERLRELGCDLGQGFLFSRAVPLDDVGDIIEVGFDY